MPATAIGRASGLLGQVTGKVLPLAVVTLLAIWFTVAVVSERVLNAEIEAKLQTRAEDQAKAAGARLENLVTTIRDIASNDLIVNSLIDPDADKTYLKAFLRSIAFEGFSKIPVILTDYKARPITGSRLDRWPNPNLETWNEHVSQGVPVLDVEGSGLLVAVPVYISNFVEGMLAVKFSPEQSRTFVSPIAANGEIDILLANGRSIYGGGASEPSEMAGRFEIDLPYSNGLRLRSTLHGENDGTQSAYIQWFMFAAFLLDLIALVAGILAAVLLVTKPLRTFIKHLERSKGQEQASLFDTEDGPMEVRQLAHAFNRFVAAEKEMLQERSQQANRLEKALDRERELNVMQRQFVSLVSHEFRTPLTIIDGNAQRVAKRAGSLDASRLERSMQIIRTTVTNLTDLMESVLSVARLEEGQIEFEPTVSDLRKIVTAVCDDYRQISAKHEIHVDVDRLPKETLVDAKLLRQVFSNLISNAIKYSPEAESVQVEGWQEGEEIVVSVRDYGRGIPESEVNRLFERFFRASTSTGIAGTGIGLHLVKHVVDLHGGRVEVTSKVDEGTTFYVRLPSHNRQTIETSGLESTKAA